MTNPNALWIKLRHYVGLNCALEYKPAIADDIERWITTHNAPVIIDGLLVKVIFSIYFNNLLYDLIQRLGIAQVNSLVSFENLNELNERTLDSSKRHIERWCTDPDYREAVDMVTKRMVENE